MKKIIAITGATGFVGRLLAEYHIKNGDEVRYLTRDNIKPIFGAYAFIGNVCSTAEILVPFLNHSDVLYHCAAELKKEKLMDETNIIGTENLVRLSVGKVKKFVLFSSTGVYGSVNEEIIKESTMPNPENAYEKSKLQADLTAVEIAHKDGLNLVILRPSNIYGVTMANKSFFGLIKAIFNGFFFFIGKKGAVANYIHVDNVVYALVLAGKLNSLPNASIYIVSDYCNIETLVTYITVALNKKSIRLRLPIRIVRALASVLELSGRSPLTNARIDALTSKKIYSSDKIKEELAYKHLITMEQGVKQVANYWLNTQLTS